MVKVERNSNIELLRIIAMLFIVMGHFVGQTQLNNFSLSLNSYLLTILASGSRIAVNVFLIIGVWFMVDTRFSAKRILLLYSQVFFYSSILTIIAICVGADASIEDYLRGFMPFLGRGLWFASAYITLLILTPFLKKIFEWEEGKQKLLLICLFVAICIVSTMPDRQEAYLCDSIWFWYVYLFIGYFKHNIHMKKQNVIQKFKIIFLVCGGGIYLILCTILHFGEVFKDASGVLRSFSQLSNQYVNDIKTLPNILCALFIFLYFLCLKEKKNRRVNFIAKSTFSVYIFHQVPAFFMVLWETILDIILIDDVKCLFVYPIIVAIIIYLFVIFVEYTCRQRLEQMWIKSNIFKYVERKIDSLYEGM